MPKSSRLRRDAERARARQGVDDPRRLGHQDALGELEPERVGGHAVRGAGPRTTRRASAGPCRSRAETLTATGTSQPVAPTTRRPGPAPCRRRASVSRCISPDCSASGMNSSGRTRPRVGWRQRTSASTPATRRRSSGDLGLVVQLELAVVDRPAQRAEQAEPVGEWRSRVGGVDLDAGALVLGDVHRDVGAAAAAARRRCRARGAGRRRCWPRARAACRRAWNGSSSAARMRSATSTRRVGVARRRAAGRRTRRRRGGPPCRSGAARSRSRSATTRAAGRRSGGRGCR